MAKIQFWTRCILGGALMVGIYSETGKWTVIFCVGVVIALEMQGAILNAIKATLEELAKRLPDKR